MESKYDSMVQSLLGLSKRLQQTEVLKDENDLLPVILIRLQQLDRYVVSQFAFGNQSIENDIVMYAGLLEEYGRNVGDKIDFLIDIGHATGGWDEDIAMHIEEVLGDIEECCRLLSS